MRPFPFAFVIAATAVAVCCAPALATSAAHPVGGATYKPATGTAGAPQAQVTLVVNMKGSVLKGTATDACGLTFTFKTAHIAKDGSFTAVGKPTAGENMKDTFAIKGQFKTSNVAAGSTTSSACDLPTTKFTSRR